MDAFATGLAVTWLHYRGPGEVTFEPRMTPIKGPDGGGPFAGTVTTVAHFSQPGTYVIRAVADDGILMTPAEITVIVTEASNVSDR
jgi:hypothetical protein